MSDRIAVFMMVAYLRTLRYAVAFRLISPCRAMRLTSWLRDDLPGEYRHADMP